MPNPDSVPLVRMSGITKRFPGVLALDKVDFELKPGEIHMLLGENGAGKSTLIKVLSGACLADSGAISILGKDVDLSSPHEALSRGLRSMLPMGLGYVEGVTHDYIRHGTTTLFAALNVLDGEVLTSCKPRHRHQEFLSFLREIDSSVPPELDIHMVVDNYATHKHPKVKAWMAARPRWHIHFIPTYSSWLNQVERFFAIITDKAIRRSSFKSVKELVRKIETFVQQGVQAFRLDRYR